MILFFALIIFGTFTMQWREKGWRSITIFWFEIYGSYHNVNFFVLNAILSSLILSDFIAVGHFYLAARTTASVHFMWQNFFSESFLQIRFFPIRSAWIAVVLEGFFWPGPIFFIHKDFGLIIVFYSFRNFHIVFFLA